MSRPFLKAAALIIVVTLAAYANSLGNAFIWDDAVVIENNDFIRSGKNLPLLFSRAYLTPIEKIGELDFYKNAGSGETSYRPVATATYFLDYRFWKLNHFGYHLTNLTLHIFNAILLFVFINLLIKSYNISLLAALFFALHPVNAEAVGVISFREELLAFLFYLSALIFYIKRQGARQERRQALFYACSLVSFSLALFSKEMAVTLPLVVILCDYFFAAGRKTKALLAAFKPRYLAYFLVLAVYLAVAFLGVGYNARAAVNYPGGSFFSGIPTMLKVFTAYLQWLVLPFNIHATLPDDPALIGRSLSDPAVLFSVALLAGIIVFAFRARKTSAVVSFAVFWFLIALLPVSNIVPLMNYFASRYLYIPAAGFCLFAAAMVSRVKKLFLYTAVLVLGAYFICTFFRNTVYKDNISLWSEMARYYPKNALSHSSLAGYLRSRGLLEEAIGEYKIALILDPTYARDHNNLGACYYENAMLADALREFRKAIELNPRLLGAYNNLGSCLGERGLYEEAISWFDRALAIDPQYVPAYNGLAITYARMGKLPEARRIWERALQIDPENSSLKANLEKLRKVER